MFDLTPSSEHDDVVDLVTAVARDRLDPMARTAEAEGRVPSEVWSEVWDLGLVAPIGAEYGGGGIPEPVTELSAIEGLSGGDAGIAAALVLSGGPAVLISRVGSPEQRSTLLPPMTVGGSNLATLAINEGYGRAPSEYRTSIDRTAEGWRVHGRKVGVAFAESATQILVVGNDANGRLRAAVVDRGGVVGATTGNVALAAAQLGTLDVDCTVTDAELLGGPDSDPVELGRALGAIRLRNVGLMLGTAARAVEYASSYAQERVAFGKPISALQGVSFMLAEAAIRLDAVRLEAWDLATRLADPGDDPSERAVSLAVTYAAEVATSVTRDAVQVLGGHGFIEDHPVERFYRSAVALSALDFDPTCTPFVAAL